MLLAIDVGNTQTVLGLFDDEQLVRSYRIKTDAQSTADEFRLTFRGLLRDDPDVTGVALCSTVPAVLREMRAMFERYYPDVRHVIVEPGAKTGVPVLMDNPKEVGADRIANSLAAFTFYGGPSIVVDFGTSTNFDVISAKGEFIGGALAPGVEISLDALAQRAAQLRKVEFVAPRTVIAKNTVEALQSGSLYGFAGQIDGIVTRMIAELGTPVTAVIATGGLAPFVIPEAATITAHRPDLTLQGLRLVYAKNA
ncbi:MAG: type III pantothenate kinase [Candidatus Nanopelagicales bacterium]